MSPFHPEIVAKDSKIRMGLLFPRRFRSRKWLYIS